MTWNEWSSTASTICSSGSCNNTAIWSSWNVDYSTTTTSSINTYSIWVNEASINESNKSSFDHENKAEERAKELLLDLIGKEQLEIYEKTGRILVKGNKYDYIIRKTGFVKRIEKDKVTDLCIHLEDKYNYPETDNVIALKTFLEADEEAFNEMANEHGIIPIEEWKMPMCAEG